MQRNRKFERITNKTEKQRPYRLDRGLEQVSHREVDIFFG
jgi:hypothetical protein